MTHLKITIILTVWTVYFFGQTTVDTKTIVLKNIQSKKVVRHFEDNYILLFDANDFVQFLDSASSKGKMLTEFLSKNDTLATNDQAQKKLNAWLADSFKSYRNSALGFGNVSIYNKTTKKFEKYLINKNTVTISTKGYDKTTTATYDLYSADNKYKFVTNNISMISSSSK